MITSSRQKDLISVPEQDLFNFNICSIFRIQAGLYIIEHVQNCTDVWLIHYNLYISHVLPVVIIVQFEICTNIYWTRLYLGHTYL